MNNDVDIGGGEWASDHTIYEPDPRGRTDPPRAVRPTTVALRQDDALTALLRGLDGVSAEHAHSVQALADRLMAVGEQAGQPLTAAQATLAAAQALVAAGPAHPASSVRMSVAQQADWMTKQLENLRDELPWLSEEQHARTALRWSGRRGWAYGLGIVGGGAITGLGGVLIHFIHQHPGYGEGWGGALIAGASLLSLMVGAAVAWWSWVSWLYPLPANRKARLKALIKDTLRGLPTEVLDHMNQSGSALSYREEITVVLEERSLADSGASSRSA